MSMLCTGVCLFCLYVLSMQTTSASEPYSHHGLRQHRGHRPGRERHEATHKGTPPQRKANPKQTAQRAV